MAELDDLRSRVRQVDDDILRLIGERIQLARDIGRIKKDLGLPLRDWEVERTVLECAAATAANFGVPPSLARSVMQRLISESRIEQERRSFSDYRGAAETIAVIGGQGKIGRWFAEFFTNQGHQVRIHDIVGPQAEPADSPELAATLAGSSFALIATPMESIPQVLDELVAMRYGGVVFDVASLKSHLRPAVVRARDAGIRVTSIHPMFGPNTRTLSDQVVCICDCGDALATQQVRAFFADTAATLVDLSFDEHDRIVSFILGLSHLTSLLFVRVLMRSGKSLDALNRVGSTTFHAQMTTSAPVVGERPELYYAIQGLNPFTPQLYGILSEELQNLMRTVSESDRAGFTELMSAARQWAAARTQK